ncbi:MAG TPA: AMP-binding protein [Anaerolineae bacterium]|nr:AMP-binding protein [Anaerolineae bacterium]
MAENVIGKLVREKALSQKDRVFLHFGDETVTYQQLDETSNRFANGFKALGITKNDKIAIMMKNRPAFLYTWFGSAKLGAVEVPINNAYKGDLLGHIINNSDSRILIIDGDMLDRLILVKEDLAKLEQVICHGEIVEEVSNSLPVPTSALERFFDYPSDPPEVDVGPKDPAAIIYTSGTTGVSKGAVCPHNFFLHQARLVGELRDLTSQDVLYTFLPLFHINAQVFTVLTALLNDAQVVLSDRFSASTFWDEIRRYGATQFNYLGAVMTILAKQEPKENDDDNPVRIAFGAACPPDVMKHVEERFGLVCLEGFGMTEIGIIVHDDLSARRTGSCGRALAEYYDVQLVDDDDREVGVGDVGEIVVRPKKPYIVMTEYYRMPDKTLEAYRNLWFHTGDYAKKDEDGYFYFVDRKKDAIRRRGENISSFEVEKVINAHPQVLECAVFAVPSELGEDEVKANVVLKGNQSLPFESLIEFCSERLAHFAVPRYVEYVTELPKTPTNRIEKYRLRELGVTENTWDREKAGIKIR